jgi:hypothetical protein
VRAAWRSSDKDTSERICKPGALGFADETIALKSPRARAGDGTKESRETLENRIGPVEKRRLC